MTHSQKLLTKQLINQIAIETEGSVEYFDQSGFDYVGDRVKFNLSPSEYIEIVNQTIN